MAKQYQVTASTRMVNRLTSGLAKLGVGRIELLTTTGRTSGEARQVPVSPIEMAGMEYLVSPYGDVGWVANTRARPEAILRLGSRARNVRLEEVGPDEAAPVIAAYYAREGHARGYMEAPDNPTVEYFRETAHRFPVFRVTPRD
ncbi:MAG TPA: nitroreductase/quinone reductase family protein [Acidimicrobiia bacterium]|jgi:deazaflavin-dependent oxidoreductase (nitroreductase family)|nr:nitroreductase/quinone reductase family protein [Acidimicrobiia bacterium]